MSRGSIFAWSCLLLMTAFSRGSAAQEGEREAAVTPQMSEPAQGCRVVARSAVSHAKIAQALAQPEERLALADATAYQAGDSIVLLPRPGTPTNGAFVRLLGTEVTGGADLSQLVADAVTVAGRSPAEQIVALVGADRGTFAAVVDRQTAALGERRTINEDIRYSSHTRQAVAVPTKDGLRSVFAMGNRILGPVDVGVIGADATPTGPVTRACKTNENCMCLRVIPTQEGGMISMIEERFSANGDETRWRTITLDASGQVLRDAAVPIAVQMSCPLVATSEAGPVALLHGEAGAQLLAFDEPASAKPLIASQEFVESILDLAVSGRDVLLVQHRETVSVVRVSEGIVDESSRLPLPDARNLSVISSESEQATLHYGTARSEEVVTISCR